MSRRYAQLQTTIWADPDFTGLRADAQLLYVKLLSEPSLSHAGVCGLTERRWARSTADHDRGTVEDALEALEAGRFVHVDEDTEEVLVRSWVRHSDMLTSLSRVEAVAKDVELITSERLRQVVLTEIDRGLSSVTNKAARDRIDKLLADHPEDPPDTLPETVPETPDDGPGDGIPDPRETVPETVPDTVPDTSGSGSGSGYGSLGSAHQENQTPPTPPADAGGDERADASAELTETERALADALDLGQPLPKPERRRLRTKATELDEIDATPDEIHRAARTWRARHDYPLSPEVLVRRFRELLALADDPNRPFDPEEDL